MEELKNKLHKIFNLKQNLNNSWLFKTILLIIIINIILIVLLVYYIHNKSFTNEIDFEYNNTVETSDFKTIEKDEENEKIIIYIIGEVNNSGVYELEENSRISDAIEKAGGVTTNADLNKINLAYQLSDGEKIKIPSIKEEIGVNNIIEDEEMEYIDNDLTNNSKETKININTADFSKLTTLPGIGESTAQKIIDYREQNGKFKNIEDLKNVSGIGESKYNQIKDYIKIK